LTWNDEKIEKLYRNSLQFQNLDIDPRLLLAIIIQEGTGSFNTNPEVKDSNGGHFVSGIISEFEITYPWLVEVAIKRVSKVKNNRGAKRYLVNFQSRFYPKGSDNGIYAIIKISV